jgi:hypothetical protein
MKYEKNDYLFDGFAHRSFNEDIDGWRNALPDANDFPCVRHANDVLDLFDALAASRKRIWELEKEVALYKPLFDQALKG